ncbi:MAG TPA: polyphenol oxidase family protein, partial [Candidatus Omnitrophota bacterium]|nr:polyphenol oxidase family protein [Candidatus Omnitrophota bacterium]
SRQPGNVCVVMTADCLPVFLCDPRNRSVGIVHAGWRGTESGIVREAVDRMRDVFGSKPEELTAVLGPCIRPCCYAVGPEFCDSFPEDVHRRGRRIVFDLAGANVRQLLQRGVRTSRIHDCQVCTCCEERFFSYRREGEGCGRNLALMVMEDHDIR